MYLIYAKLLVPDLFLKMHWAKSTPSWRISRVYIILNVLTFFLQCLNEYANTGLYFPAFGSQMTLQLGTADVTWTWMTRVRLFSTSFLYSFEEPNPFIPPPPLGIRVMSCAWPFHFHPSGPRIHAVEIMCNSTLMACVVLSGVLLLKRFHLLPLAL